jgi:hypothetical protein
MTKEQEARIRYLLNFVVRENGPTKFESPEDEELIRRYERWIKARGEDKPDKTRVLPDFGMGRWVAYKPGVISLGLWFGTTCPISWDEGDVSHFVGSISIYARREESVDLDTLYSVRVQYGSRDWKEPARYSKKRFSTLDAAKEEAMKMLYPLPQLLTERGA